MSRSTEAPGGLDFFKHVIDQTHDPVFWQSPADGFRFVYVNEAACRSLDTVEQSAASRRPPCSETGARDWPR